jgi:hypothetical protein
MNMWIPRSRTACDCGIDVTTTIEAGLISAPDEAHLEFAQREERVIFTNDSDFLRFSATTTEHRGIAYCQRGARSIGHIVRYLCLIHDCMGADEMRGRIEYL